MPSRRATLDALFDALGERLLRGPATTTPEVREAAARGEGEGALGAYAQQVQQAAYKVTPEQVAALRQANSDDALFEVTVCAAYGASERRTRAALAAIDAAYGASA